LQKKKKCISELRMVNSKLQIMNKGNMEERNIETFLSSVARHSMECCKEQYGNTHRSIAPVRFHTASDCEIMLMGGGAISQFCINTNSDWLQTGNNRMFLRESHKSCRTCKAPGSFFYAVLKREDL
jgi:hypothetical protein